MIDPTLIARLLCPRCGAGLAAEATGARCRGCGACFPEEGGILRLAVGESGAPGYDPHYFGTLPQVENAHFWFLTRREVILDALRGAVPDLHTRPLFDVGCGSGGLLEFLARSGLLLAGACDAYVEALRLAHGKLPVPLLLIDEGRLPPLGPGHPMIGLFDVLEHLDEDREVLRFLFSVLEPGGILVLTVPAHPFLFDEMDELAHHRRRYLRRDLRDKLSAAGFEVLRLSHFMATLAPLLVLARWIGRWLPGPSRPARERRDLELRIVPGVNGLLRNLLRVERLVLRHVSLPFGSSIVAVARRPLA